MIENSEA